MPTIKTVQWQEGKSHLINIDVKGKLLQNLHKKSKNSTTVKSEIMKHMQENTWQRQYGDIKYTITLENQRKL